MLRIAILLGLLKHEYISIIIANIRRTTISDYRQQMYSKFEIDPLKLTHIINNNSGGTKQRLLYFHFFELIGILELFTKLAPMSFLIPAI